MPKSRWAFPIELPRKTNEPEEILRLHFMFSVLPVRFLSPRHRVIGEPPHFLRLRPNPGSKSTPVSSWRLAICSDAVQLRAQAAIAGGNVLQRLHFVFSRDSLVK
ncbi:MULTISPECIES: hypothetical protein [unclassified Thermoactinomyces]|jgi:hypothetical protein|uniref:hypothetical protein n=1 Tax=unclassified Thermoactinomyces TaxID=2634588 RepID=UPI0018DD5752|nr:MULTISPECIES: hypothetical protein [unclassified Thermoactinomyces]MBH8598303.1 hypothetical protein [Thermoactinomyces sp. CICC 10523]MBH8604426.1 hypothetical protein [Thermoactinomyces sp. CICC 10522]